MTFTESIKNLDQYINCLESSLTLKESYDEELREIDNLESDLSIMVKFCNNNINFVKIKQVKEKLNHIKEWISEEITNK